MTILDRYFTLSDQAGQDREKFDELCTLFDEQATIEPHNGKAVHGKEAIINFFNDFFSRNPICKHLWHTSQISENEFRVDWGVVSQRSANDYFTLTGKDFATIKDSKISHLKIVVN